MAPTPFASAAESYASIGWRVFIIPPGEKIPRVKWGTGEPNVVATTDLAEVRRRAQLFPGHNIGIATGRHLGVGLAVLDIDPRHGGKVPEWAPRTATVRTPSGGVHLYYQVDEAVRSSQGVLAPGVDVRGDGGMVLAPPSVIHTTGNGGCYDALRYEWVAEGAKVARLNAALLNPPERREGRATLSGSFGEGERHRAMLSLAGTMRSKGCEFPEIQAALRALNESRFKPPLEVQWVDKMARSIMQYSPDHDLLS